MMTDQITNPDAILAQYAEGPAQLEIVLLGLAEPDLNLSQTPGTWTIREIVHHIADGDDIWKTCIKAALGNPEGLFTLQWYWDKPQTEWAENWKYTSRSIMSSLALFGANRQHIVELIRQIPNAWEKSIRIKWPDANDEERISVGDVLETQSRHVAGHISDIQMIRRTHNLLDQ